jgi:hypothetical protein
MSLEATLAKTNELLQQVITILQTGVNAPAEITKDAKPAKATKDTKLAVNAETQLATRYFVCDKYNSVFEVKAGERVPAVEGAVEVSQQEYDAKKAKFAALGQQAASTTDAKQSETSAPSQPTAEAAPWEDAAAAQSTAQPEPQPATETAATANSAAEVTFPEVVAVLQKVALKNRALVVDMLKKHLPNAEKPTVPQLAALGINAALKAEAEALLG